MRGEPGPSLAEKLESLFQTVHAAGRSPHSNAEVAAALQRDGGPTVSATYLWQLRRGLRANPTKAHLEALARFFGVNPSYFFDETPGSEIAVPDSPLLAAVRDPGVRGDRARLLGPLAGQPPGHPGAGGECPTPGEAARGPIRRADAGRSRIKAASRPPPR